jgi:hypothetical protein
VRKQTVCKFVTERFQFVGAGDALKLLTDNTDFTVIAVLGLAGQYTSVANVLLMCC